MFCMHFGARISQSHLSAHLAFGFQCPLGFWLLASGFARFFLSFWLLALLGLFSTWLLASGFARFFLKLLAFGFSFGFWLFALCFWLLALGFWLLSFWRLAFLGLGFLAFGFLAFGFGFTLAVGFWLWLHLISFEGNHETIEENHGTIEENYGKIEENHRQK